MNEGQKILLNSLLIFGVLTFLLLGFGFFIYPDLNVPEKEEVLPATDVLSVFDEQNPYAFECPETFRVVNVPVDYPTIQEAIDSVNTATIIQVASGIYNEHLVLKSNICLIGEEFGKVELQGFGNTVIEVRDNNQIKNFSITSLGKSEVGILISEAEGINIQVNSFDNFEKAILIENSSMVSVSSNAFGDVDYGVTLEESTFFISQNNIESEKTGLSIVSSEGDVLGQVITGGEYGIKADNSTIFVDANIFKNHSIAGMQLCKYGEYEIGDNFFKDTNEEILY